MASYATQLTEWVRDTLRDNIDGGTAAPNKYVNSYKDTTYTYNLSAGDNAVRMGVPARTDIEVGNGPQLWVSMAGGGSVHEGHPLGATGREITVLVLGYTPAADTLEDRVTAAMDLASDIDLALAEAGRGSGGLAFDHRLDFSALDGQTVGSPGLGVAFCTVTITYRGRI